MASFKNKLSTLQTDMVSLANIVSTIETSYSLSTVNTAPRVVATLSTGTSAQATRPPLPTAASQILGTPSSVSNLFNELRLRDLKKSNIIITGLLIDPNKSDANCASQLFCDLEINTHLKQVKRLGKSSQGKLPLLLVILPNQQILQDLLDKA